MNKWILPARAILVVLLLWPTMGCLTSFRHSVKVVLTETKDESAQIFKIADTAAAESRLTLDEKTAALPDTRGYFGPPYHYYTLKLLKNQDGSLSIEYLHEGRVANPKAPYHSPEELFMQKLQAAFGSRLKQ